MLFIRAFLICLIVSIVVNVVVAEEKKAETKKNNKVRNIDFNKIDKQWEEDDEAEELENEYERIKRVSEAKTPKMTLKKTKDGKFKADPASFAHMSGLGGMGGNTHQQTMMFVDIYPTQTNGKAWTKVDLDHLAAKYMGLLKSGSLSATVYNVGAKGEQKLLVNVERPWMLKEIMQFLAKQPEVETFEANSKVFKREDFPKLIGEEDEDDL